MNERLSQSDISLMTEEEKNQRAKELWNELKIIRSSMLRSDWHAGFEASLRYITYDSRDKI